MAVSPYLLDVVSAYLFLLKGLLIVVAFLIALSSLDDSFIDLIFWARRLYRRQVVYRRFRPSTAAAFSGKDAKWLAVLIPAWDEGRVIEAMLSQTLARLRYRHFVIFVGTYENDAATAAAVRLIDPPPAPGGRPRLHHVTNPKAGPTTKADCLNLLYRAALDYEKSFAVRFEAFVLHDAEDLIDPLELKVFAHLIPRKDMVQLPVVPFPRPLTQLVGGHYLDEFAEAHIKELVVREALTGSVPSAGVGCAFSRRALRLAAQSNQGLPFDTTSLTEDYELALRLSRIGASGVFVRIRHMPGDACPVATREFFPNRFDAAVRQKSRWLLGIALQGWENLRWDGSLAERYMLLRDRKVLLTSQLNIIAYALVAHFLLLWIVGFMWPATPRFAPFVEVGSPLYYLLIANGVFLANRVLQRGLCVHRVHGPAQALMSVPRLIVANAVNFCASIRAVRVFVRQRRKGQSPAWDKTAHDFPGVVRQARAS